MSTLPLTQRQTAYAGRGYFATRDIEPGERILQVREPLAYAIDSKRFQDTCESCLLQGDFNSSHCARSTSNTPTLRSCTGCKVVKYCRRVSILSLPCTLRFFLRSPSLRSFSVVLYVDDFLTECVS